MNNDNIKYKTQRNSFFIKNQRIKEIINKEKIKSAYPPKTSLNKYKKSSFSLVNIPINNKKEKKLGLKNLKLLEISFKSEKNENIKAKYLPKFLLSRNSSKRLTGKIKSNLSLNSKKEKFNTIFNFKTTSESPKSVKLFLRKIDSELINIIIKRKKKKLTNLKTFDNNFNNNLQIEDNFKTSKTEEINNNEILSQNENNYKSKKNKRMIKTNYIEQKIDKIFRKIYYYNQKNDLISKENIINLNQKEENSLINYKITKRDKQKKLLNKNKITGNVNTKIKLNNDLQVKNNSILNKLNKDKPEINSLRNENFFDDKNKKLNKNKIINKDMNLKANYNVEDDTKENEKNVDNYDSQRDFTYNLNIFKSFDSIGNDLENENKEVYSRRFNSFSTLFNNNLPIRNEFLTNGTNSSENQTINNKTEIEKENEIKNSIRKKLFTPKFIRNINRNSIIYKKRKSIIEGYLLNYNIKSDNYLDNILNDKNKNNIINDKNKGKVNSVDEKLEAPNVLNPEYKNQLIEKNGKSNYYNNNLNTIIKEKNSIFNNINTGIYLSKDYSNKKEMNNFINQEQIKFKGKNEIINQQKLEKNLSDMHIIYEENEPEKNDENEENKYSYFFPNKKDINNIKSAKNKDIDKYIAISNEDKIYNKDNQNLSRNNKYSFFNNNKTEKQNVFNSNIEKAKVSNNKELYKKNIYNNTKKSPQNSSQKINSTIPITMNNETYKEKKDINEEEEINDELDNYNSNKKDKKEDIKINLSLNKDISIKELSFLENKKIDQNKKTDLIKQFKEKALFNLFSIVNKIFDERRDLKLNIEILTKFLRIEDYKKYINILKLLMKKEKEKENSDNSTSEKEEDSEIINYIYNKFSDENSQFYLKPKKENNININNLILETINNTSTINTRNNNLLSHKRYLTMSIKKRKSKKQTGKLATIKMDDKETNHKNIHIKKNLNSSKKTIKQFINEGIDDADKQKKEYLTQKVSLTNELKYQIEITHDIEGKGRFQILLDQIQALKNDNLKDYIKSIREKYENLKKEMKKLISEREKEERINYFINGLIDERANINKLKKITGKNVTLEDYKF